MRSQERVDIGFPEPVAKVGGGQLIEMVGGIQRQQAPDAGEIQACQFWLNLEREFVKPKLIVAMGATAIRGVLGKAATISSLRGKPLQLEDGTLVLATVHPSYLLRLPDRDQAAVELERFEADLKLAQSLAEGLKRRPH